MPQFGDGGGFNNDAQGTQDEAHQTILYQIGASPLVPYDGRAVFPTNPFNGATSIRYSIPKAGGVSLDVYDAEGAIVERLVNGYRMAGEHLVSWESRQRASGMYFCRLRFGGYSAVTKMILIR